MSDDEALRGRVGKVIAEDVLPALEMDGVTVEVVAMDRGVAQVRLGGACGTCPSTTHAILMGIERELCRRVPEVAYLEAVV